MIMSGKPIIKRLWRVLWRIKRIVIYKDSAPPNIDSKNSVFSGMRHLLFAAQYLSIAHTNTDTALITAKYITAYSNSIKNHRIYFIKDFYRRQYKYFVR